MIVLGIVPRENVWILVNDGIWDVNMAQRGDASGIL